METPDLTTLLTEVGSSDQGNLITLSIRKKGIERGRGSMRRVYDNDTVQVLLWTGFSYRALVERSQKKLDSLFHKGNLIRDLTMACTESGRVDSSIANSCAAIQDVQAWFYKVLQGKDADIDFTPPEGDTAQSVWKPLLVGGVKIRGSRVYAGPARPEFPRAPVPGHIYVHAAKLGENVITPAPNGHWQPKSAGKTAAKQILLSWLPVGLFAQYVLCSANLSEIKVGAAASAAAKSAGVQVDPEALRSLFKIAA